MNLTLRDLLHCPASQLRFDAAASPDDGSMPSPLDRTVSWPVSMRATPPHLPRLEPGALVLVPTPVFASARDSLPTLLRELGRHDIAALVVDRGVELDAGALPLLRSEAPVGPDLEAAITRLLHEQRADLYHRAAEFDRALVEVASRGGGRQRLLAVGAEWSGRDIFLLDGDGAVLASFARERDSTPPLLFPATRGPVPQGAWEWYRAAESGDRLVAVRGPRGTLNAYDRLVVDRVATAIARQADSAVGPPAFDAAGHDRQMVALLAPNLSPVERRERALALGLDPTASFVAVAQDQSDAAPDGPCAGVAPIGPPAGLERFHADGTGLEGQLLHARDADELQAALDGHLGALAAGRPVATGVSEPARLDGLPDAWKQARFACEVVRRRLVNGPVASWTRFDDLGVYRLLFPLWQAEAADRFVATVLRELPAYDQRHGGVLLPTLRTYLASGGVAAAAASELAIHRNTLSYRLRRVAELTGRSPLDPRQQLALHLATLLHLLMTTPARSGVPAW